MDSNSLLYELQSGFHSSFSTDSCLIHLSDFIRKQQDKGHYPGMVILDLQKAFDTVNHKNLFDKLRAMGVGQIAVQWFNSYLSGRQQLVNIADTNLDFRNVLCGVPQGSILGPLLFLVYVNDMKAAVKCKLLLYADDSALLVSGKDVLEIERILSVELGAVSECRVRARYYKVLYLFWKNKMSYKVLYFIEGLIFFDRSYIFGQGLFLCLILDVPYQFVKAYIFKDTSVKR